MAPTRGARPPARARGPTRSCCQLGSMPQHHATVSTSSAASSTQDTTTTATVTPECAFRRGASAPAAAAGGGDDEEDAVPLAGALAAAPSAAGDVEAGVDEGVGVEDAGDDGSRITQVSERLGGRVEEPEVLSAAASHVDELLACVTGVQGGTRLIGGCNT